MGILIPKANPIIIIIIVRAYLAPAPEMKVGRYEILYHTAYSGLPTTRRIVRTSALRSWLLDASYLGI